MHEILIADDHPLFREALRALVVKALRGDVRIQEAASAEQLFALVKAHPDADLLLLDLNMPGANGFEPLVQLRAQWPQLPVVIVSAHEDAHSVQRAMNHGAAGFVPKSTDASQLAIALQNVLAGDVWFPVQSASGTHQTESQPNEALRMAELTPQQFRVLQMAAAGLLNKQIAYELGTSEATIKAHMTAVLRKLGATNRTQAVSIFNRLALPPAMLR